ncbi:STAS domain-containing protein [Streptomyces sp. NPDC090036]|uniref:STAS domain-containing protein n=1 Tax=Streptomyces sp. NPDC090036 TaxID=3365926 RepID=UPI0038128305
MTGTNGTTTAAHSGSDLLEANPDETHVVHVCGEMDLDHVETLRSELMAAMDAAPPGGVLVVDLLRSSFCDSSGLGVLLEVRRRARESGRVLRLTALSHQMVRLLELSGSADLFEVAAPDVRPLPRR